MRLTFWQDWCLKLLAQVHQPLTHGRQGYHPGGLYGGLSEAVWPWQHCRHRHWLVPQWFGGRKRRHDFSEALPSRVVFCFPVPYD